MVTSSARRPAGLWLIDAMFRMLGPFSGLRWLSRTTAVVGAAMIAAYPTWSRHVEWPGAWFMTAAVVLAWLIFLPRVAQDFQPKRYEQFIAEYQHDAVERRKMWWGVARALVVAAFLLAATAMVVRFLVTQEYRADPSAYRPTEESTR
jgi:hypothetical protein